MPWKACEPMDERLKFVARLLDGEKMAGLCREFSISRKTGYKILSRALRILHGSIAACRICTVTVTACGRTCFNRQKINLSQVFDGQNVGIKQVSGRIWLVTFMDYDLGYFDDQTCRLEPLENPFGPKMLPMSPV
jgi:hypothetical protein